MIKYFFKIVYRTFLRNKLNSFINIFGLAIGLSSFILISLYVNYELSWDTHNENYEKTFLVNQVREYYGQSEYFNQIPGGIASGLKDQIPEIEKATCITEIWGEILSSSKYRTIYEQDGFYADNDIFDILTIEFIAGNPSDALSDPNSIVFTESLAMKHFGNTDVIGKSIKTDNRAYTISAVIKDLPFNSNHRASYFISWTVYKEKYDIDIYTDWDRTYTRNYVQLKDPLQKDIVCKKAAEIINANISDPEKKGNVYLQTLPEIHLNNGNYKNGFFYIVAIYSFLGILILILSAINFLNLSTAQSSIRTKEIGVKKVFGSFRSKLIVQFLAESVLNSIIALILAFGIAEFLLPFFGRMTDRALVIDYTGDVRFVLFVVATTISMGFISGLYPAFYLSRFNPIQVLKSGTISSKRGRRFSLKKVLIGFQFVISIVFIISTIGFFANCQYIMNMDVGFEKENILFTTIRTSENLKIKNIDALRGEFMQNDEIENISISYYVPFNGQSNEFVNWEGAGENQKIITTRNTVGDQFLATYKIPIVKGRNISNDLASDSSACVVNEKFVRQVGWDDPIGKKIDDNKYTIVGVVRNFHVQSPVDSVNAYVLTRHDGDLKYYKVLSFRLKPGYSDNTVKFIKDRMQEIFPDNYFKFKFINDDFDSETNNILLNVVKTMMYFTWIAVLIALVGLFSLVSFSIKRKVKEIGIRKIMGASVAKIYIYLTKEFIILLIISNIIAIPLGILLLKAIPFSYTPDFNIVPIIIVALSSFVVTLLSISYWVLKTARANPVDSLRYE